MTTGPTATGRRLARQSRIVHPSGNVLETPLLVPSFSSKGFSVNRNGETEVQRNLKIASEFLTDSMLISAYDISHELVPGPSSLNATPEIIFVDSGGYEATVDHDLSTTVPTPHVPKEWTPALLTAVYDAWPERFTAVFVNYDHPKHRVSVAEQTDTARLFLARWPKQLHTFLLKPATEDQRTLNDAIAAVEAQPALLSGFDIIGITEKEIGTTMLDRMKSIARLRLALDGAGMTTPLHVFGALDPLTASLYFLAGAEIFDGLTWLRYAYHDGLCVYTANFGALHIGISERDYLVRSRTFTNNISYLKRQELVMRRFANDPRIELFPFHRDILQQAHDSLRAFLEGRC